MVRGCAAFFLSLFLIFLSVSPAFAIVNPQNYPNNRFGIHILQESDILDASKLVNSNGGEWGYVTVLIQDDDMDKTKWQRIFDQMRESKLIPLVRIATHPQGQAWVKPKPEEAQKWAEFLSSLNWVIKNRYVILFNEPNQDHEWEGQVNPQEYTRVAKSFRDALKQSSEDFFVLPAGFDMAAPNSKTTMDATLFWQRMYQEDQTIFTVFDGWDSHAYPNPDFSASPTQEGRLSIKSYDWEIQFLRRYGLPSNLPIFITETGWTHKEGKVAKVLGETSDAIGNFFEYAYTKVWDDPRVIAVTPFVLNYQNQPFDHFSWKKTDTEFYSQYQAVQNLSKQKGEPFQEEDNIIIRDTFAPVIFSGITIPFLVSFQNTGQSIWDEQSGYSITTFDNPQFTLKPLPQTKPGHSASVTGVYKMLPGEKSTMIKLAITHNNQVIGQVFHKEIHPWITFSSPSAAQRFSCFLCLK